MPYKTNEELPDAVKGSLPASAQSIFRNVFNSVSGKGADEKSSLQQAWGAVKNAGYEKDKDGKWRKVKKSIDPSLDFVLQSYDVATIDKFFSSDEGSQAIVDLFKGRKDPCAINNSRVAVVKVDADQRLVFGFFNICKVGEQLVEDLQGDLIETYELEKAAYDFVLNARVAGEGHVRKDIGRLVESVVLTYEKQQSINKSLEELGIEGSMNLGCEAWFGGFKISDDDVWKAVREGDYPAFSIGGKGTRIPLT